MFPIDKYKFYRSGNKVYAVSTYEGKTVRAKATCHEHDEFSEENGKKLAALRCGEKIAIKRRRRAMKKIDEASKRLCEAKRHYEAMIRYYNDATDELKDTQFSLAELSDSL